MNTRKVAVIGAGAIAKHLSAQLKEKGVEICFSRSRSKNTEEPEKSYRDELMRRKPDAVFLAISTLDKGEAAHGYMLTTLDQNIPIITCEKGSLAYWAESLRPRLPLIGYSAAVGGGTRMLKYLQSRHLEGQQVEIHAVLNGTLNYVFDLVRRKNMAFDDACRLAVAFGLVEPGPEDPLSILSKEFKDLQMKTCIFFNTMFATNKVVKPDDLNWREMGGKELEKFRENAGDMRPVISFINHPKQENHWCVSAGRKATKPYQIGDWYLYGAFHHITHKSGLESWLPKEADNAIHIIEGMGGCLGTYTLTGPGAGVVPTVRAMLADYAELCP